MRQEFRHLPDMHKAAIAEYAHENGRRWKSRLAIDWENGNCSGVLQEVRNKLGPSGLAKIRTAAVLAYRKRREAQVER